MKYDSGTSESFSSLDYKRTSLHHDLSWLLNSFVLTILLVLVMRESERAICTEVTGSSSESTEVTHTEVPGTLAMRSCFWSARCSLVRGICPALWTSRYILGQYNSGELALGISQCSFGMKRSGIRLKGFTAEESTWSMITLFLNIKPLIGKTLWYCTDGASQISVFIVCIMRGSYRRKDVLMNNIFYHQRNDKILAVVTLIRLLDSFTQTWNIMRQMQDVIPPRNWMYKWLLFFWFKIREILFYFGLLPVTKGVRTRTEHCASAAQNLVKKDPVNVEVT